MCVVSLFLSVEEGKVAAFLLATTAILCLRYSILNKEKLTEVGVNVLFTDFSFLTCFLILTSAVIYSSKIVLKQLSMLVPIYIMYLDNILVPKLFLMSLQAIAFVLLISILRFTIELGLSKQATNSTLFTVHLSWILSIDKDSSGWTYIAEIMPILAMIILAYLLHKSMAHRNCPSSTRYVVKGTIFSYMLIGVHWILESDLISLSDIGIKAYIIPRMIYAMGFVQLVFLALGQLIREKNISDWKDGIVLDTVAMLSAWSSTVIILSGKQGAFVALASIAGGTDLLHLFICVSNLMI